MAVKGKGEHGELFFEHGGDGQRNFGQKGFFNVFFGEDVGFLFNHFGDAACNIFICGR